MVVGAEIQKWAVADPCKGLELEVSANGLGLETVGMVQKWKLQQHLYKLQLTQFQGRSSTGGN